MDLADGVAMRLTRLCLRDDGLLFHNKLIDAACRAAVLLDLALSNRLEDGPDGLTIDSTPTGFTPADVMLSRITDYPGRTLNQWIENGPGTLSDLVAESVRTGAWTPQRKRLLASRRYQDSAGRHAGLLQQWLSVDSRQPDLDPVNATLILVANEANLMRQFTGDKPAVEQCGAAQWLVADVLDRLSYLRGQFDLLAISARQSYMNSGG